MEPLPGIPDLSQTIRMFIQGCASYERAMNTHEKTEAQTALQSAGRDVADAMEWALKIYLENFPKLAPEDRRKLDKAYFSDLMDLMEKYGDPPLKRETRILLFGYRAMRNRITHGRAIPPVEDVWNAIVGIREIIITYLHVEEGLLKVAHSPSEVGKVEAGPIQQRGSTDHSRVIKILFLAANPSDTARLRLDQEVRDIDLALRQTEFRHLFEIKQHLAVRVIDLQGYLLRYKPDIVHFSGHGDRSSQIILEDNDGRSRPVPPDALSNLFRELKGYIRLVVLNACYTEQQARAIAQHIECVVGMSGAISDPAAISFAVSFYQALGFGTSIETAFSLGCVEINLESLGEENKPKLLTLNSNSGDIVFALPKDEDLPGESPGSEIKSDLKIKKQKGKLTILDIEGPGTLQKSGARKIDTTTDIEETGEGSITTGIHFGRSGQRNNSSAKDEFGN